MTEMDFRGLALTVSQVTQHRITMNTTATVRDLRNQFPKVRKLVEMQDILHIASALELGFKSFLTFDASQQRLAP